MAEHTSEMLAEELSELRVRTLACAAACKVAAGRAHDADLRSKYREFGGQCEARLPQLDQALEAMGCPPHFAGLDARLAQFEADSRLDSALVADDMPPEEMQLEDLEHMALTSTHDRIEWQVFQLAARGRQLGDGLDLDRIVDQERAMNAWAMEQWMSRKGEQLGVELPVEELTCPVSGHHEQMRHGEGSAQMGRHQSIEELTGGAIRKGR